jgi:hypothetical protein
MRGALSIMGRLLSFLPASGGDKKIEFFLQ